MTPHEVVVNPSVCLCGRIALHYGRNEAHSCSFGGQSQLAHPFMVPSMVPSYDTTQRSREPGVLALVSLQHRILLRSALLRSVLLGWNGMARRFGDATTMSVSSMPSFVCVTNRLRPVARSCFSLLRGGRGLLWYNLSAPLLHDVQGVGPRPPGEDVRAQGLRLSRARSQPTRGGGERRQRPG